MVRVAIFLAGLVALTMAGCSGNRTEAGGRIYTAGGNPCPQVGILGDANEITVFNGAGRDITDVHFEATITDVRTECSHNRRWGGARSVNSNLNMRFEARLGSAAVPRGVSIPYFVAVVDPASQQILAKEIYSLNLPFNTERRTISTQDEVDRVSIPLSEPEEGGNYEILVGFELTPDQLDFNRRQAP